MRLVSQRLVAGGVVAVVAAMLSACGPKAPPVVVAPPPPPPPVIVIPPQPVPPLGAVAGMTTPLRGADGLRITVNSNLTPQERVWHVRSALNVAALNCQSPQHLPIADNYNRFIAAHKRTLDKVNREIDANYRKVHGAGFARIRDTHMTQVYNYFALPPMLGTFCDAALPLSAEAAMVPSAELGLFADRALPQMEALYEQFYNAYDQYQYDLAVWMARYAPQPVAAPEVTAAAGATPGS